MLFTVSATMHRGGWSPPAERLLTRMDHRLHLPVDRGDYTPFTVPMLSGTDRVVLLSVAWAGAALGITFRLFRPDAPRWVYTPIYIALGWVAVFFAPQFAGYPGHAVDRAAGRRWAAYYDRRHRLRPAAAEPRSRACSASTRSSTR